MHFASIAREFNSYTKEQFVGSIDGKKGGSAKILALDQRVIQQLDGQHCEYLLEFQPWQLSSLSTSQVIQMMTAGKINCSNYIHLSMSQLESILQNKHKLNRVSWSILRGLYSNVTVQHFIILWNDCNNLSCVKEFLLEYVSNQTLDTWFKSGFQNILIKMCEEPSSKIFSINGRLAGIISGWNPDEWYSVWSHLQKLTNLFWLEQQMIIHGDINAINPVDFQRWNHTYLLPTFTQISQSYKGKALELARKMEPRFLLQFLMDAPINELLQLIVTQIPVSTPHIPFDSFWQWTYENRSDCHYNDKLFYYAKNSGDASKIEIVLMHLPKTPTIESKMKLD